MLKRLRNPATTGLIFSVVILVLFMGVIASSIPAGPTIPWPWKHLATLKVELADANALIPHASVEMAGVKVGEVQSIEMQGDHAVATLNLESAYSDVHQDARVALRPHGLFGSKYISILPGTARSPLIGSGGTIPVQNTIQPVDLDQILKALQAPEAENLRTFLVEFGKAAAGRGDTTNHLIGAADTLTQSLQVPLTALDSVTPNLNDMLVQNEAFNASFAQAPLDQLVANNEKLLRQFAANADHLESLLVHADSSLTTLDASLNGEGGNIKAILEKLPTSIDRLDQFNRLIGLLTANLTGKDKSVPNDTNVTSGIISAIENPKSAYSSFNPCTPGANHCGPDGQQHYLRAQTFNSVPTDGLTGFGDCLKKILNAPPTLPSVVNCPPTTGSSNGTNTGPSLAAGDGMAMMSAMLGA